MKPVPSLRVVIRIRRPWRASSFDRPICGLILFGLLVAALTAWNLRTPLPSRAPAATAASLSHYPSPLPRLPERLVYPYSVVPGGVSDSEEAAAAARRDPAVRLHYAAVQLDRAWMASNQHVRFAHVSYRKGDRLFWTRNKVRIPAGERILTDGRHEIRARCGNRIEDSPEGEVEPEADAPLPVELVTPILEEEPIEEAQPGIPLPVPSEIVTSLDLNLAPTLQLAGDSSLFNSWQYEPALGGAVFIHPFAFTLPPYRWAIRIDPSEIPTSDPEADPQERSKRHSEVPEPSTFALFLTGAAAVLLFARPRVNLTPAVTSENAPSTTPSPD